MQLTSNFIHAKRLSLAAIAFALLAAGACRDRGISTHESAGGDVTGWNPTAATSIAGVPAAEVRSAIQQRLGTAPKGVDADAWHHVRGLYGTFAGFPLWMSDQGIVAERAASLTDALAAADSDALDVSSYPITDLAHAIAAMRASAHPTAAQIADADVLMTAVYVELGEDMLSGQVNPRTMSQSWFISTKEENVDSTLARALRDPELDRSVAKMRPQDAGYDALRKELVVWRQRAAARPWTQVPNGKALKPRETDSPARLAALAERLRAEGLYGGGVPAAAAPDSTGAAAQGAVYDGALAGAVALFQSRHGIAVDSILGTETVESLNKPATYRLGQIAANLERYRWLPRSLGSRYILVNVPAFQLQAFDEGKPKLEMKVIVGQEYEDKATPVFSDSMQFVVFRPYWIVPDSIAAKEIYPKAAQDPSYMDAHDYETAQIDGKTRVRQKPGNKNSLGFVKFMFPNDFNIYLHDTPENALFAKDVRAYSHGCIRLEHPDQLAQFVLGWSADSVRSQMQQGKDNHRVNLPRKIPVYIVYFTTYAKDNQLYFGNDLYNRDGPLVTAVSRAATGGAARSAVDALRTAVRRG